MNLEKLTSPEVIKQIFRKYNFQVKKGLGQNFLVDENVLNKIVESLYLSNTDTIMEIGSGLGTLTRSLAQKAGRVIAIELDKELFTISKEILKNYNNLKIMQGDILKINFNVQFPTLNFKFSKIVSNLPYYISTPVLIHLLKMKFKVIFVSLQKEMAKRIIAPPGNKDYGILSIITQYYTEPKILFSISKDSFFPSSKVDSSFLKLETLTKPKVAAKNEDFFFSLVKMIFRKRRKTLQNALLDNSFKWDKKILKEVFRKTGIEPKRRAETLALEEFAKLANCLSD